MSEQTPELQADAPSKQESSVQTPQTPGVGYAYVDQTKEEFVSEQPVSDASHALLNPAYYPKDLKPEAVWTEAEKSGEAESPNDFTAPSAPGTDENLELPEEFSDEAAQERTKKYEEMANKDLQEGKPAASSDPEKAVSKEEAEAGEGRKKVTRKPKS